MQVFSLAVVALMATQVHGFRASPLRSKRTTSLGRSSYLDKLNDFTEFKHADPVVNGAAQAPAAQAPPATSQAQSYKTETAPAAYQLPPPPATASQGQPYYQNPQVVLVPPQPVVPQAAVAPQPVAPPPQENSLNGAFVAAAAAFVGIPIWIFAAVQLNTPPPVPATPQMPVSQVIAPPVPATPQMDQGLPFTTVTSQVNAIKPAVADRYSKDGVLLPTLSDVPRNDYEGIKDYFVHFLEKKPVGKILEGEIFIGNNWAQDAGIYEFTFEDGNQVKARYSFVYVYEDGQWKISHHHSSLMPEETVRPTPISKGQVRALFNLWNDALATGDPQKVAARYSSDAVLLPTLSDSARYTNDRIADYFVHFLEKKPRGEILEGNIKVGANWAQDAGIYEFTFEDGSQVQGRYSFVYTYEGGQWKISHHHSSIMPEGAVAAMKKVAAMEKQAS